MNGYMLIDKPKGWTSFDVVNKIRYIVQSSGLNTTGKKRYPVGHTGTLDPLATGLLVILLGNYTKRAPELTKLDKTYDVTIKLGETSTTGDEEGEKTQTSEIIPALLAVQEAVMAFCGEIEQIPPVYSAIKIDGKRAYSLARAGTEVKMQSRLVKIYGIEGITYKYPFVTFSARVSSGTYVRTLAEDIGKKLGVGAYMCDLRRTKVGTFDIVQSLAMEGINSELVYDSVQTLD